MSPPHLLHPFLDGDLIKLAGEIGTVFFRDWHLFADAGQSQSLAAQAI